MNKTEKNIRCVNLDNNKVRFFPESICTNAWWQKNTRFVPQPLMEEPTIINQIETSEAVTVNAAPIAEIASDVSEIKTKRKYKKRKSL
jgi:hypothetical protein